MNDNSNVAGYQPANCAGVIAVASIDSTGSKASTSNYGPGITISAPGDNILSTLNTGTTVPVAATYASYSGTSMATPHVAGVVALMQSRRLALGKPLLTPSTVRMVLTETAYPLPGSCPGGCGAGIVDAGAAVERAGDPKGPKSLNAVLGLLLL